MPIKLIDLVIGSFVLRSSRHTLSFIICRLGPLFLSMRFFFWLERLFDLVHINCELLLFEVLSSRSICALQYLFLILTDTSVELRGLLAH